MYWILRRTGAVNFFSSLNNNSNTSGKVNHNNNGTNDNEKSLLKRPQRKAYGRLNVDSDSDFKSLKVKIDTLSTPASDNDDFNDLQIIRKSNSHSNIKKFQENLLEQQLTLDFNLNDEISWKEKHKQKDQQKKQQQQKQQQQQEKQKNQHNQHEQGEPQNLLANDENYLSRLQPITITPDDEDYEEALTCNVCDRAFRTIGQLASHQQKKRHFGCSECDSLFTSSMLLEHHKDEFEHWDKYDAIRAARSNEVENYAETDSFTSEAASEDLERLL